MDLSGKEIVVIGSGNVEMDIACESWRLGASKVTAIDIQKPLAFGRELDLATELGTKILWPKLIDRLNKSKIYFRDGYELNITSMISGSVSIPVIASGGAGKPEHLRDVFTKANADAALIASMVHYRQYRIDEIKSFLAEEGIPVRKIV